MSIKQSDITQLNKDNAQPVTELGTYQKRFAAAEQALQQQRDLQSRQQVELQMAL